MKSVVVVTSWWSNCLALHCLHTLSARVADRPIFVMQAGKSARQMELFRQFLPAGVVELHYPSHLAADDSRMREYLALTVLADTEGAWFLDHDMAFLGPYEPWLRQADTYFGDAGGCIAVGAPRRGFGVTQPAYWLSPARWPRDVASFDPIPFHEKPHARRPDLFCHDGELVKPEKDTLVQAYEELRARGLALTFPLTTDEARQHALPAFPSHTHIGGIHLYTGPVTDARFAGWFEHTVNHFARFYASCPPEWLAIEDPALWRRHQAYSERLDATGALRDDTQFPIRF